MNPESTSDQTGPGWGWPIAVVVIAHLCVAAIPVDFSTPEPPENPDESLSMVPPPDLSEPAPPAENERSDEPEPELEEPQTREPVEPIEPRSRSPRPDVVTAEREPVDEETPVEEPSPETSRVDDVLESDPLADMDSLDIPDDFSPTPRPPAETGATDSESVDWNTYGNRVMESVRSQKDYPRMARRMGWEGDAMVRVVIDRSGALEDEPEIVESTTHGTLDEEVLRMVEAAAPFEAFPGGISDDRHEFLIPVRFRLEG